MKQEPAKLSVVVHEDVHVMVFPKREMLDAFECDSLGQDLYSYIERLDKPKVVIDLGAVSQISSAAIGMLITAKTITEVRGGRYCLAHVGDDAREILRAGKLEKILSIHASTDAAIRSIA
ncbi:MAG: STAS domain-containing protein [Planctomycetota bacterium]|jgi:anti-anti-sigma factor